MTLTESLLSIRVLQKCPPSWHSCLAPNQDSSVSGDVKCKKKFPQISQLQQINSNCPVVFSCGKARQVSLKSLLDRSTQPGPSSWMCKYSKTTAAPPGSSDFWKPNPGRLVPPKPGSSTQGNHQGKPGIAAAPKFLKNTLWWLRNPAWYLGRFFPDKFQSPQSQEKGPSLVSSILFAFPGTRVAWANGPDQPVISDQELRRSCDVMVIRLPSLSIHRTKAGHSPEVSWFQPIIHPTLIIWTFPMLLHNPSWFPCHWPRAWKMMSMSNTFQNTSS